MSIGAFGRDLRQLKIWLTYGSELLWIRAKMLRLDAIAQLQSIILLILALISMGALFFLSFISLLFGLNAILSPIVKIWVFFGIAILFLLLIIILIFWVIRLWRKQNQFMTETLAAISEDLAYLKLNNETRGNEYE